VLDYDQAPARSARPRARTPGRAKPPTSRRSASRGLASWRASCARRSRGARAPRQPRQAPRAACRLHRIAKVLAMNAQSPVGFPTMPTMRRCTSC
jgi:hypothetical protein